MKSFTVVVIFVDAETNSSLRRILGGDYLNEDAFQVITGGGGLSGATACLGMYLLIACRIDTASMFLILNTFQHTSQLALLKYRCTVV